MIILNQSKNIILANQVKIADTVLTRMTGLLKHSQLIKNEALVIMGCNSIHMFFMKFAIDVIFVNKLNQVVGLVENIKPNRLSKIYWKASSAIELPAGIISSTKTEIGDKINFQ